MTALKIGIILVVGYLGAWGAVYSLRTDSLYSSIELIGQRLSLVVPTGKDQGLSRYEKQYVRMEPVRYTSMPAKRPAFVSPEEFVPLPRARTVILEQQLLPALMIGFACLALGIAWHKHAPLRRWAPMEFRRRLTRSALALTAIAIVIVIAFISYRIVLTGIEYAQITRSQGTSRYLTEPASLAMDDLHLIMLYIGLSMLAFPAMLVFALRFMDTPNSPLHGDVSALALGWRNLFLKLSTFIAFSLIAGLLLLSPWASTFF